MNGVKQDGNGELLDDTSGEQTIDFLTKCRRIARRINSDHPSSLGLHPAVYFYSKNGNLQPASLYAITALMLEFERRNIYDEFIKVRDSFEELLLQYNYLIPQIVTRYRRSASRSFESIKSFYMLVMQKLKKSK